MFPIFYQAHNFPQFSPTEVKLYFFPPFVCLPWYFRKGREKKIKLRKVITVANLPANTLSARTKRQGKDTQHCTQDARKVCFFPSKQKDHSTATKQCHKCYSLLFHAELSLLNTILHFSTQNPFGTHKLYRCFIQLKWFNIKHLEKNCISNLHVLL